MQHYAQDDPYEREPLDSVHNSFDSPPRRPVPPAHGYSQPNSPFRDVDPRYQHQGSSSSSIDRAPAHDGDRNDYSSSDSPYGDPATPYGNPAPPPHVDNSFARSQTARLPPPAAVSRQYNTRYTNNLASNTITPGADNFSDAASGGMAGIAYTVAERNARESGVDAMRSAGQVPPPPSRTQYPNQPRQPLAPQGGGGGYRYDHSSYGIGALPSAASRSSSRAPHSSNNLDPYADDPYQGYAARSGGPNLGVVNPNEIEDDGDDGLHYPKNSQRNSMLSSSNSDRGARSAVGAAAAVGGATAAGGALGGLLSRNAYNEGGREYDPGAGQEKSSAWLAKREGGLSKRCKLTIIIVTVLVVMGAVIGGIVGGVIANSKHRHSDNKDDTSSDGQSADDDEKSNGDLSIISSEIKDLLDNPNLHRVFPGMDYTPINTQYPDCLDNPPSQNNITRDVAVLSQLTNKIRLYGTDCNQTEMVVHAVKQLKMEDDVKIWLGVWQDGNSTTNARQLEQMWTILEDYGGDPFEGIIVANEILFREEMTIDSLGEILDEVRTNLSDKGISLPVATSDLGDDWTAALAADSDYVMANIHPFFSGVDASKASAWTFNFWEVNDGAFFKSNDSRNIISETGWPTDGGTSCGAATTCDGGSVAGIDELNQFMEDFVCAALKNGTNYFWFEAFDEPWKIHFNTKGKNWEDKWGLMDVNRNLKDGVKIPDCGGSTV